MHLRFKTACECIAAPRKLCGLFGTFVLYRRTTEWVRLEGRSSGPAPLLKEDHLETVAQDHVVF